MKQEDFFKYEPPQVEFIEVEVEKGFATSTDGSNSDSYGYNQW